MRFHFTIVAGFQKGLCLGIFIHLVYSYTYRLRRNCAPDGHLQAVTTPEAVLIQFDFLRMCKILLETCTCRGS